MHMGLRTAILILTTLLSACASSPTHYFTLSAVPPSRPVATAPPKPIEVSDIPLPAVIDRNAIVLNTGNDQLNVSSQDLWGAPLGQLVRQALTADLQQRLPQGSVLLPGATVKGGLSILKVTIEQFMGGTDGKVLLNAGWSLLRAGTSDVLHSGRETITVQAASGKIPDIAPAMSKAIGEFADRIVAQIS